MSKFGDKLLEGGSVGYIQGPGYRFYKGMVEALSLRDHVDKYYLVKRFHRDGIAGIDDVDIAYGNMIAVRYRLEGGDLETLCENFTDLWMHDELSWTKKTLRNYIKDLVNPADLITHTRILTDEYAGIGYDSASSIYKSTYKKIKADELKAYFVYEWMLRGNYLRYPVFAKYLGLKVDVVKGFFYKNKNLARYVKIYNNILNLSSKTKAEQAYEYLISDDAWAGENGIKKEINRFKKNGNAYGLYKLVVDKVKNYA